MTKAFGYARKSPDDKEDTDTSISNQIKLIENFCTDRGIELVKIFIDKNISGGDRLRKEFVSMIDTAMKSKDVKMLIVKEQDRFARDSSFFVDTLRDLDASGITVFSIIKNNFLSYEDLGDVVTSVVDAHFIITNRKKAKVLFEQKMREGLPPIPAPFGYKSRNKTWDVWAKKAKIVREVCDDYIKGVNFRETLKRLDIRKSVYYRVIENAKKGLYSGFVVYTKKTRDSNKKIIKQEEVKYLGNHKPLISQEICDRMNSNVKN